MARKELIASLSEYSDDAKISINYCNISWFEIVGIPSGIGDDENDRPIQVITLNLTKP